MNSSRFQVRLVAWVVATWSAGAAAPVQAITVTRDPVQGAGIVDVEGGVPLILGAPVNTPLEVDFVFNEMRHIELIDGASTNIEFGIGNTGNNADLEYRVVFDLSDMQGNLITNDALVVDGTASAGTINIVALPLTPLPAVIFHDFHIRVEAEFIDPNTGSGLFDLYVAGGGGDLGTSVSGPIRFHRAIVGEWVPEPGTAVLGLIGLAGLVLRRRRSETNFNRSAVMALALAVFALAAAVPSADANLLSNPSFETVGPLGDSTTVTTMVAGGAGFSAAESWTLFHNTGQSTTRTRLLPTTLLGGGTNMIHVFTTGPHNGLVQVFGPLNTGPDHVVSSAWVYVLSGEVGIGTGNGGNTGLDALSTTTGQWEFLQAPNGVAPANEFIVYSSAASTNGAEFYVDLARVVPEPAAAVLLCLGLIGTQWKRRR